MDMPAILKIHPRKGRTFKLVIPPPKSQQIIQKSEPVVSDAESAKQAADSSPAVSPPKVDFATNLFDMLSMDGPSENGSEAASADDNAWAGFQSAAEGSSADKTVSTKPDDNNTQPTSGIEDLFKDSTSLTPFTVLEKPKKDVKNDIMSLFDKSNVVSPFSVHQQQLAMLAQQQSLLMAAAAKSAGVVSPATKQPTSSPLNCFTEPEDNSTNHIPGIPFTPLEPFDNSVSMVDEVISGTDDDAEDPTKSVVFSQLIEIERERRERETTDRSSSSSPPTNFLFRTCFHSLCASSITMNEKANVSKELNAKHRKILEGLLKLPENRECADCKSKGPRWASVNLGIFVCMQCSGIHRSLGVHISKVRSATLDTWLPEQVAFIQSMGNEKANCYWEAELPPNYDRVGIENFIRAKYEEKRWVAKDSKPKSPSRSLEEKASVQWQRPGDRSGNGYASNSENSSEERKNFQASTRETVPATRISIPVPPKGPESVIPPPKSQQIIQKSEPVVSYAESAKQAADSSPAVSPPKVHFATDLFDMLSMDGPSENGSEAASADDNAWAGFQSAAEGSTANKTVSTKPDDNNTQSTSGIEDLFKDSPSLAPSAVSEKPKKDVKNDIMSLFDKSNVVSPFSVHQQQLAMLAQQQSLLMAAAAKSAGVVPQFAGNAQLPGPNGTNLPTQNWPNVGCQFPGLMMPAAGNVELQKYMQQIGNMEQTCPVGSSVPFPTSSTCTMGQNPSTNGVTPAGTSRTPSASPIPSATPTQTAKDYDFSSLTQGMFSKS
ncbi:hypothetical protein ACSBR1_028729 [Camellia fascicularis]